MTNIKLILSCSILIVISAILLFANRWHTKKVQDTYNSGKAQAENNYKLKELEQVKVLNKQISELNGTIGEIQDENIKLTTKIRKFERDDTAAAKLRNYQQREFLSKTATASIESLRELSEACDGNFTRSREHVKRFGLEAAECSGSFEAQRKALEATMEALQIGLPKLPNYN